MKKLARLRQLPTSEIRLLFEISVILAVVRIFITFASSRYLMERLGPPRKEYTLPLNTQRFARRLGQLIQSAARSLPWESKCLSQALVGKIMLSRRAIPCTAYIGVNNNNEGQTFAAHAWLKCGDIFITGRHGHKKFTPLEYAIAQPPSEKFQSKRNE